MKTFTYTIKDELGIHARPAGLLVKAAGAFQSDITIATEAKKANAKRMMAVMGLGVKCGTEVTITAEGADEDAAIAGMEKFLTENL
ncbi:MAG TPA: HPr family phosphocarrier protein [Candidatus Butyricicoccus avistercoris]|uniref:HPr family phosphocarrier protein n=1 Tax=Candidatus Butyricicoccus avistercoris TaxID=2838518 RepID=A0A9D1PJ05_9FIRM|nr:HPr family phosphocarrier protein [Candidatus Butyricicoccus avistercoris]